MTTKTDTKNSSRSRLLANSDWQWGTGAVLGVIILWEVLARTGALPAVAVPSASDTIATLVGLLGHVSFWAAIGHTLQGAGIGIAVVVIVAVPLGLALGRVPWIDRSTLLVIEFLKPIPPVALLPLALLFYGPTLTMKTVLVFLGALWPLLVQVAYAARSVEPTHLDFARSYRLDFFTTLRSVFLPGLTPYLLTGLRISISIAIIIAVVAELIGGAKGVGQEIAIAQNTAELPTMYAYIIATGLLGILINALFTMLERPLLFWHASQRKEGGS